MNALSLKGFLTIALIVGLVSGGSIGIRCAQTTALGLTEVAFICIGALGIGFVVASGFYMVQLASEIRNLRLSEKDLLPSERVLLESPGTLVHFRTGRPSRFWDAVGGNTESPWLFSFRPARAPGGSGVVAEPGKNDQGDLV